MKTVTLVEIGNDGHRTAYMRSFIAALIVQDCRVLCIIPDPTPIRQWIETHYPALKERVSYRPYPFRWTGFKLPQFISVRLLVLYNLWMLKKIIRRYEKEEKNTVDFIFFNYVDKFVVNRVPLFLIDYLVKKKWAALLIHSGTYRLFPALLRERSDSSFTDHIFNSPNCLALAIHDEGITVQLNNRLRTNVILFPEIADLTPPDAAHRLSLEIKSKAKGRIVVGTIGLEPHKCGYEFLQLAKHADPSVYYFVFAGIFNEHVKAGYDRQQQEEFSSFFAALPENCLTSFGHIEEGTDYNSIFCSFDVVYLMYKHFYNASNRLTKAASFQKLVLSSDMGCIGEDIKKYHLGELLAEINTEQALEKLNLLRAKIAAADFPVEDWKTYSAKHHTDLLNKKFKEIFQLEQDR